jgi:MFS family permease
MKDFSPTTYSYRVRLLAILALINFVNFAYRLIVPPLVPLLRAEFGLSSTQLSLLQGSLQIVLAIATIPLALLGDRYSRTRIITYGMVFCSLVMIVTGMAHTFMLLLVARALVGVGEAAYAPSAQSMISGAFTEDRRAGAQAIFAAGMLAGATFGLAAGGFIGQAMGWRPAFYMIGVPGVIIALLALTLEEPTRGPRSDLVPLSHLLSVPAFLALILAGVLITFTSVAVIFWGPEFVKEWKDFSQAEAGISLGITVLVASLLGVLAGGYVADWSQKHFHYGRILTVALAFFAATPFIIWGLYTEEKHTVLIALFIAAFFMSWYHGPITAVIHDMMPRRAHATSIGIYMFVTQLIGGVLGPFVVGQIDDRSTLLRGLQVAVGVMVAGACTLFLVIYFIRRDGLRHPKLDQYHAAAGD